MKGRSAGGRGTPRYQAANQRRGERARDHLTRQRQRGLRRRKSAERERERARHEHTEPPVGPRLKQAGVFALALAVGVLLANPIQYALTTWTTGGLSQLETIAIQGNDHLSFQHVARATGVAPGSDLAEVEPRDVVSRLADDAWIREARVMRVPPSTLLVHVEERRARAVLVNEDGQRLVDESGNPFADAEGDQAAGLPRLIGGGELASYQGHAQLVTALELVESLHAIGALTLSRGGRLDLHLPQPGEPEGWRVHAPDGDTWVVLGRVDLMERFGRLVELLENEEVARSIRGGDETNRFALRGTGCPA